MNREEVIEAIEKLKGGSISPIAYRLRDELVLQSREYLSSCTCRWQRWTTGAGVSPPLGQTLGIIGRDSVLSRIDRCIEFVQK